MLPPDPFFFKFSLLTAIECTSNVPQATNINPPTRAIQYGTHDEEVLEHMQREFEDIPRFMQNNFLRENIVVKFARIKQIKSYLKLFSDTYIMCLKKLWHLQRDFVRQNLPNDICFFLS